MDSTWAIVELMGRSIIAGRISEENVAGVPMLRVDVPELPGEPAYTKYFAGNAIYAITPTDEGTATRAAQRLHIQPISPYIVAPTLLPAHATPPGYNDEPPERGEYGEDEDDVEVDPPVIV